MSTSESSPASSNDDDPLEERLLRRVEVLHEVDDAAGELERLLEHRVGALVAEADLEALVEERHLAQPLDQRLGAELGLLEDRGVGPERDGRAVLLRRRRLASSLSCGLAALGEVLLPLAAVAVDLEVEAARQRVDHRHADAVEAAGDLVALAAELPAGVQHGQHDLGRRLALVLGVVVDRDAAAVVGHAAAAVGEQRDVDPGAVAGHRLVDRVVDDLVDEVVQTGRAGGSDVHPGAFADRFEALENGDVLGGVRHARAPRSRRLARTAGEGRARTGATPRPNRPEKSAKPQVRGLNCRSAPVYQTEPRNSVVFRPISPAPSAPRPTTRPRTAVATTRRPTTAVAALDERGLEVAQLGRPRAGRRRPP